MPQNLPAIQLTFNNFDEFFQFVRKTGDFVINLKGEPPIFQSILSQLGELHMDSQQLNAKVDSKVAEILAAIDAERTQVQAEFLAIKEKLNAGTLSPADVDAALAKFDAAKSGVDSISQPLDDELAPPTGGSV